MAYDASRLEACLEHLGQTLGSLAQIEALDPVQREAVTGAVDGLLAQRDVFVERFADAFDRDALHAYRGAHRVPTGIPSAGDEIDQATVDEALHYFALQRLAESCEPDSAGHLQRTAAYCRTFARELGCDAIFVDDLWYAARLHDIGLIAVPRGIMDQRGQIDSYERVLLDTHTRAGAFLVNSVLDHLGLVEGPLVMARDVALYHHERHDGLGVLGLEGEAIPYASRIFQFADVYDALRRRRPHREPLDHEAAVAIIRAGNQHGAMQFDPQLVEPFLACAPEFGRLHDEHAG